MGSTIRLLGLDWIDLSVEEAMPSIISGLPFALTVTASQNERDDPDTDSYYDADVNLSAIDNAGNAVELSPAVVTLVDGTVTEEITATVTGAPSSVNIYAELAVTENEAKGPDYVGREYYPKGKLVMPVGALTLVFTVEPSSVTRDTNFSYTIQAQDGNGNPLTGRTDTITITLVGADVSDVFTSPTPDAVSYTAALTAGQYAITTQQITGGSGAESGVTITATATATGFIGAETEEFAISEGLSYATGVFGGADLGDTFGGNDWLIARSDADDFVPAAGESQRGGLAYIGYAPSATRTARGGKYAFNISTTPSSLEINWYKGETMSPTFGSSVDVQIRYSNAAPETGTELRTSGTVLTTISIADGEHADTGSVDGSAAISGTSDIYVWAVAVADVNGSGYPTLDGSFTEAWLRIESLVLT